MNDLISRQAVIDAMCELPYGYRGIVWDILNSLPSVQPEQKHGKWLNAEHAPNYLCYCTCSACGKRQTIEIANYCPNCGAKMDMERE